MLNINHYKDPVKRIKAAPNTRFNLILPLSWKLCRCAPFNVAVESALLSGIQHCPTSGGAATHDIGKTIYTNELSEAGHKHEQAGLQLLLSLGISEEKSKCAASHSSWSENSTLEELLVSLADKIWKGNRVQDLEDLLIERISTETKTERWEVFGLLDSIIDDIAKDADKRLSFQNNLSTTCSTT